MSWTAREVVFNSTDASQEMYSPCINYENGKYKVWFCRQGAVRYQESLSSNINDWTGEVALDIDWASQNLHAWHLDVIKSELGYEMVVCAYDKTTGNSNAADLFYTCQDSNGNFSKPVKVLARSKDISAIDYKSIYRSSLLKMDGSYYLFYSCIDNNTNRWMSLATGTDVQGLNGIKSNSKQKTMYFAGAAELNNLDVSNTDFITIAGGEPETVINGFTGGFLGKKITVVSTGGAAHKITFTPSSNLVTAAGDPLVLDYTRQRGVDLVCTSSSGRRWAVLADPNGGAQTSIVPSDFVRYITDRTKYTTLGIVKATDTSIRICVYNKSEGISYWFTNVLGFFQPDAVRTIYSSGGELGDTTIQYSTQFLQTGQNRTNRISIKNATSGMTWLYNALTEVSTDFSIDGATVNLVNGQWLHGSNIVITQLFDVKLQDIKVGELTFISTISTDGVLRYSGIFTALSSVTMETVFPIRLNVHLADSKLDTFVSGIGTIRQSAGDGTLYYFADEVDKVASVAVVGENAGSLVAAVTLDNVQKTMRVGKGYKPTAGQDLYISQEAAYPALLYRAGVNVPMVAGESYAWEVSMVAGRVSGIYETLTGGGV